MAEQGTRLESEDDVRRVLQTLRAAASGRMPATNALAAAEDAPPLFRPTIRPPIAILTVCDDGTDDGELIRIRTDRFVIGRTEGDLIVPNDAQISSRHAELRQFLVKDKYCWSLVDLQSTNGTYVRVGQAVLEHGQEFFIGRTQFRFESQPAAESAAPKPPITSERGTRFRPLAVTGGQMSAGRPATLVELNSAGEGSRFCLESPETWVGKDASLCQIVMARDLLVNARHARIRYQDDGQWLLENNRSVNGIWLRIEQISFQGTCRFMLGEQRFVIRAR